MTRKLEELFELPTDYDEEESIEPVEQEDDEVVSSSTDMVPQDKLDNLSKIDSALPAIKNLEAEDKEMDDIAQMAIDSYKDLLDLGMNVEARVANEILGSASQFLGHAITAKNAKVNKKLRMIELQLRKARLDLDITKERNKQRTATGDGPEEAEGKMLDRNELLAEILKQAQEGQDDKKE